MKKERQGSLECLRQIIASGSPFQHTAAGMMSKMVREEILARNSKKECRRQQYYRDVTVMVSFHSGEVISLRFGLFGGHISISSALTPMQIKQEMEKQLTGWQFRDRLPKTFPERWRENTGIYFHKQKGEKDWYIFASSMGTDGNLYSFTPRGRLVSYCIDKGFGIEVGYETPFEWEKGASRTMETFRYGHDRPPEWFEKFMVDIVTRLFEDKRICAISANPYTFETIYTRREAETHKGFRLVPVCPVIHLSVGRIKKVWKRKTIDKPNWYNGTFLFPIGKNVFGVMDDREDYGYVLPYTFEKIQFYPEGLPVGQLMPKIESIRVI